MRTALLLLTFAVACSDGSDDPSGAGDGGNATQGGNNSADGGEANGNGSSPDGGDAAGGNNSPDGGSDGSINGGTATGEPVNLGTAKNYAILAKTGISSVAISPITGDIAVSPIDATAITGFSLKADATTLFATSTQVTGRVYAANYKPPTPAILTTAVGDMELAFTDAAGRAPNYTELGAGMLGGKTLAPGVYKWGTGVLIATDVTLEGSATDVWIFQIAKGLTLSSGAKVILKGAARPENIFWQVTQAVNLGTTAHLEGVVLSAKAITLRTRASVRGRLLAQTAVVLDKSTVTQPAP